MKKLIAILTTFTILLALGCKAVQTSVYLPDENCMPASFKPGSEPDGFNGIKWETNLSTLKGMKLYRKDPSHGGIDFYLKEGDMFKLGEEVFRKVQYGFWREKFYVGMVSVKSLPDWQTLKKAVFLQFGEGAKPFHNKDEYIWFGQDTIMALQYNEILKIGIFYIRSESMAKKMESN